MPSVTSTTAEEQKDVETKKWNALKRYIIRERQRKKEEYEAEVEEERLKKEREARERQDVMTLGAGSAAASSVVFGANNVWTCTLTDVMQPTVYQQNQSASNAATPFPTPYSSNAVIYPLLVQTMAQPSQPTVTTVPTTQSTQSTIPLPRWLLEFAPQVGRDYEALAKLKLLDEGFTLENIWECMSNYARESKTEPREPTRKEIACINFWKRNEASLIRSISRSQPNPGVEANTSVDTRRQLPQQSLPPREQVADSRGLQNPNQMRENSDSDTGQEDIITETATSTSPPPQPQSTTLNNVTGQNAQVPPQNAQMPTYFATYNTAPPTVAQNIGSMIPNVAQDAPMYYQSTPIYVAPPMPLVFPSNAPMPTTYDQPKANFPFIVVRKFPNWIQHLRAIKEKLGRTPNVHSFGQGVRFTPVDSFELSLIQLYLTSLKETEKLSWSVQPPPTKGSLEVSIMGLPSGTAPKDVEEELKNLGFAPEHVRANRGRGKKTDTFFVTLMWKDNLLSRIYEVRELLCFPGIKIEIKRWKKGPVQSKTCLECHNKLQNHTSEKESQKKSGERPEDSLAQSSEFESEDSDFIYSVNSRAELLRRQKRYEEKMKKAQQKDSNVAGENNTLSKNRPSLKNRMRRQEKRSSMSAVASAVTHLTIATQTSEPYTDDTENTDEEIQRPMVAHVTPYSQGRTSGEVLNAEIDTRVTTTTETAPNVTEPLPDGASASTPQAPQQ